VYVPLFATVLIDPECFHNIDDRVGTSGAGFIYDPISEVFVGFVPMTVKHLECSIFKRSRTPIDNEQYPFTAGSD